MKWLDTHVRAFDGALQQAPEVLQPVCVYHSVNVGLGMIHNLVGVFIKAVVRLQCISVERSASRHVIANRGMKRALPARADYRSADLAGLAFQQSEHNR